MVVPEKASSFNIHPERCCSDTCHYCATRFGSLDTPLHVSQLKTSEVQRFAMEFAAVSPDACLCDKCYRYIDRKAKELTKANKAAAAAGTTLVVVPEPAAGARAAAAAQAKDEKKPKSCIVRTCNREVSSSIFFNVIYHN